MTDPTARVAFLRGINLGKRRITNERLREVVERSGIGKADVYQASGNVVVHPRPALDREALEPRLESHLHASLGYPVDTLVRSLAELETLAADDEVQRAEAEGFKAHVVFLRDPPNDTVRRALTDLEGPDDRFLSRAREVVWLRRGRLTDSTIEPRHLEKALGGTSNTMRTLGTVRRIVTRFGS